MPLTAHITQPTTLPTVFPVHWNGTKANNAAGSCEQTVSNGQKKDSVHKLTFTIRRPGLAA